MVTEKMRIPFKTQIRFLQRQIYLMKKPRKKNIVCESHSNFDLVTVSFNNEVVVDYHLQLIKENLTDDYVHTVFDNSSDNEKRKKIENICKKHSVNYIVLPANPYRGEVGSASHGVALNWIYRNFIRIRKPIFFGFLDHDIFPVKKTSLLNKLSSSNFFGKVDVRGEKWYLWPGFSFYRFDYLEGKKVDFMPEPGVDTGGRHWRLIFSKVNICEKPDLPVTRCNLQPGDVFETDMYEKMGSWIHTVNASQWFDAPNKNVLISKLLENYL